MRLTSHTHTHACTDTHARYLLSLCAVQGGDLFYAIIECQYFKESDAAVAMRNLGHALMYLHNHRIAHRGVSPENLFVSFGCEHCELWSLCTYI